MSDDEQMPDAPVTALARFPRVARAFSLAGRRLALAGVPRAAAEASWELERTFLGRCRELSAPSVLELGTKQSVPGRSTMHRDWVPHASEFLGSDVEPGGDVDVVAASRARRSPACSARRWASR